MPRRPITHEEFLNKFYKQNTHAQDIEILGTYKNNYTKIKCKCKVDGYEWETIPKDLLSGHGCAKCGGTGKLTHEQFIKKFNKQNTHAKDIEILGTYTNNRTKILCKCKVDGYEWTPVPDSLLQGVGCPKCAGNIKLTHEQFIERLHQINPNIEVLGTYVNSQTKIKFRCAICGHEWKTKPNSLLNGCGCLKCGHRTSAQKQSMTQEQFITKVKQINPNIEVLGTYKNNRTKILCKCKKCGYEWKAIPHCLLLRGTGCPKCNTSKGEKRIAQYLDNLGIDYIYNIGYFKDLVGAGGGLLRPDFVIPSLKIWIEFDGRQHFEPINFTGTMSAKEVQQLFKYTQQNDQIKNQYAKDNNWNLIRIPYTDYDNIEQILAAYIEQEEQVI